MADSTKILFVLSVKEKEAFNASAQMSGMTLSAWMRQRLRAAAMAEHKKVGKSVEF